MLESDDQLIVEEHERQVQEAQEEEGESVRRAAPRAARRRRRENNRWNWKENFIKISKILFSLPKNIAAATFQVIEIGLLFLFELLTKRLPKRALRRINAYRDKIIRLLTWLIIILLSILVIYYSLFSNGGRGGNDHKRIESTGEPHIEVPRLPPSRHHAGTVEDLSDQIKRLEDDTRSIWLKISDHHSHLKSIKQSLEFIMFNQENQRDLLDTLDLSSEQVSELILQILQNASFWNNFFQQVQDYTATIDYPTTTATAVTTTAKDDHRKTIQEERIDEEEDIRLIEEGGAEERNGVGKHDRPLMELLSKTINDIVHKNMVESIDWAINKYHHQNLMPLLPKIITNVVEFELSKYHQDLLNTADFALGSRGGRIIHSITSSTYHSSPAWLQSIRHAAAYSDNYSKPEMAIFPDIHAGECWSMRGQEGTLGILLSETIHVKAITVEHPSQEVLRNKIHHAPKEMELFGILKYPSSMKELVPLVKFEYNIHAQKHLQTFQVPAAAEENLAEGGEGTGDNNMFKAVVLKIYSNWGNEEHTDIYRIRIHGEPTF